MLESLTEGDDWRAWMEQFEHADCAQSLPLAPHQSRGAQLESWDKTDRPLQFPARHRTSVPGRSRAKPEEESSLFRGQWLKEHDVHTRFLDAGIGCCWFAQQGDDEPVCGQTEDAAIARLARENGLPWTEAP